MKIAVVTGDHFLPDPEKPGEKYSEEDLVAHQKMVEAFTSFSDLEVLVFNDHSKFIEQIVSIHPELVVNFCDTGFRNKIELEVSVPAFLEMFEIPYTGSTTEGIISCYDKSAVRLVADSLGIKVPKETYVRNGDTPNWSMVEFPSIIKPNRSDGSFGITKDAVVESKSEAEQYINWLTTYLKDRDFLIQQYLPGGEYGVGLVGNSDQNLEALPLLEVDYSKLPSSLSPILSYESKTDPTSPYWNDIRYQEASLTQGQKSEIVESSKLLFRRLRLRDYGRFDFRQDKNGELRLMEVNPNPAWGYDAKLALMASFGKIPYRDFLNKIINVACHRLSLRR